MAWEIHILARTNPPNSLDGLVLFQLDLPHRVVGWIHGRNMVSLDKRKEIDATGKQNMDSPPHLTARIVSLAQTGRRRWVPCSPQTPAPFLLNRVAIHVSFTCITECQFHASFATLPVKLLAPSLLALPYKPMSSQNHFSFQERS